jgi:TonB family protein
LHQASSNKQAPKSFVDFPNNNDTRLYISLFGSVIFHSLLLLFIFLSFPKIEKSHKTIPLQLIQNERQGSPTSPDQMSRSENALAAQEFLRTLNEATFEQLIQKNTHTSKAKEPSHSPFRPEAPQESSDMTLPRLPKNNQSNLFEGLQNIFSRNSDSSTQNEIRQISTKSLDELSDYEVLLLQRLARNELYDDFHKIMIHHNQDQVDYTVSLFLFPNGAIKNARIKESSNIADIDRLAIQAAFQASPYPKPPQEDINTGLRYDIPIIYKKIN